MIDIISKQTELLGEHYSEVIEIMNKYYKNQQSFILRDLLSDKKNNHYYIHMTKGILLPLLDLGYIKIIGTYNGYKNFNYLILKEIK